MQARQSSALWPGLCSAHALRQTSLFEAFYRDILYRLRSLLLCQTVLLCLVISVRRVGFGQGRYGRGWSSSRSGAMATLCSVNGIWQNYPTSYHDCSSEMWRRPNFRSSANHVKRCQIPWLSRSFFKLESMLKHLTWPSQPLCQSYNSSLQIWLTYWKQWAVILKSHPESGKKGKAFSLVSRFWATVSSLLCWQIPIFTLSACVGGIECSQMCWKETVGLDCL